jgi:carboxymethylenebutenolidase
MTARVSFTSRNGSPVDGALAIPSYVEKSPAVVVIQEYWGLNDQIKNTCERFAAEGFIALAPDLFGGTVTKKADEAKHLMSELDWPKAIDDITGAVTYLREHPRSTGKVAVMGFCMGGALSLAAACNIKGLSAVVPFYGIPGKQDWSKVDAPIQAHAASKDDWATPSLMQEIAAEIEKHGGTMEVNVHDADHAFFNETRPEVYNPEAAEAAWKKMIAFLTARAAA